jgi:hypothetical protein
MNIEALVQQPILSSPDRRAAATREELSERNSSPRQTGAAGIKHRIEQSQRISAAFQFGLIAIVGAVAAMTAVNMVGQALSAPLENLSSHLLR